MHYVNIWSGDGSGSESVTIVGCRVTSRWASERE
jgi:hypothetical protein